MKDRLKDLRLGVAMCGVTMCGVMMCGAVLAGPSALGQMHKVAKPQQVVRAVGVYEWTGDMARPTASRLIPVSLYINGKLEDAGIYLARPVPFALETGNVYELEKAGVGKGLLDLSYARRVQTADGEGRGAWLGYGSYKPPVAAKRGPVLRASKTLPVIVSSGDNSRPHFGKSGGTASSPGDSTATESKPAEGGAPAGDPDRPTLKGHSAETGSGSAAPTTGASNQTGNQASSQAGNQASNDPADDPDRPTLKRRSPEEAKKAKVEAESQGDGAVEALNNDPNRPNLHYGKPAGSSSATELPKLVGTPADLRQMVAVSDAVDRDQHDFARPWADGAERASVLAKMEEMARAKLAAYVDVAIPAPPAAAAKSVAKKDVRGKRAGHRSAAKAAVAPVVALFDTQLKGYTLSYGGAATYIFSAHTAGTGAALRYVTVVAQADDLGNIKPALQSVTDAAHLDRTPEMRFVDAVDAEASNRASLLFELRSQGSRQFALYRVIAAEAQLTFAGGPIQ